LLYLTTKHVLKVSGSGTCKDFLFTNDIWKSHNSEFSGVTDAADLYYIVQLDSLPGRNFELVAKPNVLYN